MSANTTVPPSKWTVKRIEEIFSPLDDGRTLHQGWSPQCEKEPSPSEDVWGVLKTTSIQAGEFQPEHNKRLPASLEPRPQIEVKEGDLLLTCAGPRVRCGVACLVRQTRKRLMMSGKMYRFRVEPGEHDARYVEAFLQTEQARQAIDKMKTGSSDSGLNLTHERFRQLPIPVAPFPEQRRIVAEIEKQFTRLETGAAALRRVQANLKRYRAAVLKAACEGKLVQTEAELTTKNTKSTKTKPASLSASSALSAVKNSRFETGAELLARILTERRQNWQGRGQYKEPAAPDTANLPPLPEGWTWATVEQLAAPEPNSITDGPFGSNLKTEHYMDSGPRVIRLQNIGDGVYVDEEAHITKAHFERLQKHRIFAGDVVIAGFGENPPRCCIIPETLGPAIVKADCIRFRPHSSVLPKYMNVALNSDPVRKRTKGMVHGVGRPRLNLGEIKSIVLPLPPLAEQTRIVAEVERRLSVVEELESVVTTNLQRASRLRQSILQKAFTGQLA